MNTTFYDHWRKAPEDAWRWPNFSAAEIACRGTGAIKINTEAMDKLQALRDLQTHAVDVVHEQQERHHGLAALLDAELGRLLHRIDGVAAGIGEADYLCFRTLRLQQEGCEVRGSERMLARSQHLAAVLLDVIRRLGLNALAQRIVDRDKIPVLAATLHHRGRRGVAGCPGVVDPLDGVG